jgi:protein gp37
MREAHWHRFQVLTKRADRLAELNPLLDWAPNVWMGVSVEQQRCLPRAEQLKSTGAHTKFLSIEPLLESLVPSCSSSRTVSFWRNAPTTRDVSPDG